MAQGDVGLEMASREKLDLILVDLQLPDMNGYQLLDALLKLLGDKTPPVVAHTGQNPSKVGLTPAGAYFWRVLQKPASRDQFELLLEEVLDRIRQRAHRPTAG